ncbi:MAG: AlpA family phage regulatory protein [Sulfuricurvum sp.]|nr:AlpA family phage regulatory protein [Sulfuricurvum sp.]
MKHETENFLRLPQVAEILSIGKSTVWYYVKKDILPKPIKLSPKVTVWLSSDIQGFLQARMGGA